MPNEIRTEEQAEALINQLRERIVEGGEDFGEIAKTGRTHLMDAAPVTLGQQFSGYAAQVERGIQRVEAAQPLRAGDYGLVRETRAVRVRASR